MKNYLILLTDKMQKKRKLNAGKVKKERKIVLTHTHTHTHTHIYIHKFNYDIILIYFNNVNKTKKCVKQHIKIIIKYVDSD